MKTDYETIKIIENNSSDEEYSLIETEMKNDTKLKTKRVLKNKVLQKCLNEDERIIEIGVDEAGRGPLFGRVYTAAVILPKDNSFDLTKVKDSKKFHSKKKIQEAADYIKTNALAWCVTYEDERKIDEINILQATQKSMHSSINEVCKIYNNRKINTKVYQENFTFNLLIDGNYFNPITYFNKDTKKIEMIPYITVEGGDNKYATIAAASILAKVERDKYIDDLCKENPELESHYSINSNKGYGAKKHLEGIKKYGITIWHRRTFAPCKNYV